MHERLLTQAEERGARPTRRRSSTQEVRRASIVQSDHQLTQLVGT
jgi:hypothetical protein